MACFTLVGLIFVQICLVTSLYSPVAMRYQWKSNKNFKPIYERNRERMMEYDGGSRTPQYKMALKRVLSEWPLIPAPVTRFVRDVEDPIEPIENQETQSLIDDSINKVSLFRRSDPVKEYSHFLRF